jgi:uncharacterized membrane protein YfcA
VTAPEVLLLAAGGFAAGALNAAAGGGSLISFPALLATGLPALTANITNTVALCPGYLGGVIGYRNELRGQRGRIVPLVVAAVAGSVAGVVLLEISSQKAFNRLVPFLVLAACALLAAQPWLARRLRARPRHPDRHVGPALLAATAVGGTYGSYFGAGLGVALLAVLGVSLDDTLQRLNALKGTLSFAVNTAGAVLLAILGPVHWLSVLVVAPAALAGGRSGVVVARRLSDRVLRGGVIAFGVVVAVVLLAR